MLDAKIGSKVAVMQFFKFGVLVGNVIECSEYYVFILTNCNELIAINRFTCVGQSKAGEYYYVVSED